MSEKLDAPDTSEADSLLAAAQAVDQAKYAEEEASADSPAPRATGREPVTEPDAQVSVEALTSNSETETAEQKQQRERDEKGRFVQKAKAVAPTKPESEPEPVKDDSAYAKAQKERDRQRQVLANFEEEKRAQRAELFRERQELEKQRAEFQSKQGPPRAQKDGFTAPEYRAAARDFSANGDHENALKAIQAAEEIERFEWSSQQQAQLQAATQSFSANMEEEIAAEPDLGDGNSALSQEVQGLLKDHPYLAQIPKGFSKAVEIARLRIEAGSVSELRKELETTKAELERLTKAAQPVRGGPTAPSAPRKFDALSSEEMHDELLRAAEELDMQPA